MLTNTSAPNFPRRLGADEDCFRKNLRPPLIPGQSLSLIQWQWPPRGERCGERFPPSKTSRLEPLNRSSRRKEALISLCPRSLSLLTSAATKGRFMGRTGVRGGNGVDRGLCGARPDFPPLTLIPSPRGGWSLPTSFWLDTAAAKYPLKMGHFGVPD